MKLIIPLISSHSCPDSVSEKETIILKWLHLTIWAASATSWYWCIYTVYLQWQFVTIAKHSEVFCFFIRVQVYFKHIWTDNNLEFKNNSILKQEISTMFWQGDNWLLLLTVLNYNNGLKAPHKSSENLPHGWSLYASAIVTSRKILK